MKHIIFIASTLLAFAPTVYAQSSQSTNLTNTATVVSDCSIQTTQNILFPSVNLLTQETATAQGSFAVRCTKGSYNVQISNGMNMTVGKMYNSVYSGTFTDPNRYTYYYECNRAMKHISESDTLPYELYAEANMQSKSYNSASTSGSGSISPPKSCGTGSTFKTVTFSSFEQQQVNVYAKALITKNLKSGAYVDTISIIVTF